MWQSYGQGTRAGLALLSLCLACDATKRNDIDMVGASDAMYEAARMEHPVPLTPSSPRDNLGTAPRVAEDEVVRRRRAKRWAKRCVVQHRCPALRPLPKCKAAAGVLSDFPSSPAALLGRTVKLRGALYIGGWVTTAMGCQKFPVKGCCNAVGGEAVLLIGQTVVALDRLGCGGDDSGTCCDVPAYGQSVVASGKLSTGESVEPWSLEKPELCVDQ